MEEAPLGWMGTLPEWLVYQALEKLNIDFDYQSSQMGGRLDKGGAVIDFYLPGYGIGINVNSIYWHYNRPGQVVSDELQRESLEGQGIIMIYIDEDDILRNAFYYVSEALKGNDHSRVTR